MYMYMGIEVHVSATEPRTGVDEPWCGLGMRLVSLILQKAQKPEWRAQNGFY